MKFASFSAAAALALVASSVEANDAQRLVIFAGPHGAASTTIETFYRRFASDAGGPKHGSFAKWDWPNLQDDDMPLVSQTEVPADSALSLLVTADDKEDLQEEIMQKLHKLWTREDRPNIILGTEELDRIGLNPFTGYNALHAVKRIANRLELSHESIEIVLNYRTPRIDQWISIWKHITKESLERYRPFLCTVRELNVRKVWEMLDTAMNPLKVAQKYRENGFRVTLIDMAKAKENERDVVHVLGCDVLGLPCGGLHPNWIDGLYNKTFFEGHEDREYPNFSDSQISKLDATFRNRDCFYKDALAGDTMLKVVNAEKNSIWEECHGEMISEYQRLADTTNLFNELRKQRECAEDDVTVDMITGETQVEKEGSENITIAKPEDAATVEEKEDIIEDLEEKKEAIKEEEKQIDEEEEEINEEIGEQEDAVGGNAESAKDTEEEDVKAAIEEVEEEIKENPDSEAALAAKSGEDADYKSPDASSGATFGVLVPAVVVGALVLLIIVRRRRANARQPLPVEFAQVDEEFGDATMEDMQPRYVD